MSFRNRDVENPRQRIDARPPSAEKAAGMRRLHHDTDGTVIGGVMPDGTPVGTRVRQGPVDGSRLGNPTTPGLDRLARMNAPVQTSTPDIQVADGVKPLAAPAQSNFRRPAEITPMTATQVGTQPFRPGQVDGPGLTPQIANNTPGAVPAAPVGGQRINRLTGKPFGYTPPETGRAIAENNIAKMGLQGAIADRAARTATEKPSIITGTPPAPQVAAPSAMPAAKPMTGAFRSPDRAPAQTSSAFRKPAGLPRMPAAPAPAPQAAPAAPITQMGPPASAKPAPRPAAPVQSSFRATPSPGRSAAKPGMSAQFAGNSAAPAKRAAELAQRQAASSKAFDTAYNAQPNLPIADPSSVVNRAYKGLRARYSGR